MHWERITERLNDTRRHYGDRGYEYSETNVGAPPVLPRVSLNVTDPLIPRLTISNEEIVLDAEGAQTPEEKRNVFHTRGKCPVDGCFGFIEQGW